MDNKFMDNQWDNYSDLPLAYDNNRVKNEIQSVQFKDDYIVIETLGRTYSIRRSHIRDGVSDGQSVAAQHGASHSKVSG